MKRCYLFPGKRPGRRLGVIYLSWRIAKKYSRDNPMLCKLKNGRWGCIIPEEFKISRIKGVA